MPAAGPASGENQLTPRRRADIFPRRAPARRYIGIVNIAKLALSMIDHLGDKGGKQSSGLQHLMALKHIQDAKLGDLAGA